MNNVLPLNIVYDVFGYWYGGAYNQAWYPKGLVCAPLQMGELFNFPRFESPNYLWRMYE